MRIYVYIYIYIHYSWVRGCNEESRDKNCVDFPLSRGGSPTENENPPGSYVPPNLPILTLPMRRIASYENSDSQEKLPYVFDVLMFRKLRQPGKLS